MFEIKFFFKIQKPRLELLAASMFAGKLDQNGAAVKPNDAYLMFKFLKLQTDRNAQKVPASTILEIALGQDVASIKAEDFQQVSFWKKVFSAKRMNKISNYSIFLSI